MQHPGGGVQVVVVDVEHDAPTLVPQSSDGRRWSGAWLVVRDHGEPVGIVEVSYDGPDVVRPDEVRERIAPLLSSWAPRRLPRLPDAELPVASVVVASNLARPGKLRACLEALTRLDYPDPDIVVVDNHRGGHADRSVEDVVAGLPGIRVVREPIPGVSAARNAGIRAARGEIVAFTDDDVEVDAGWLRAVVTRFVLRPDEDVVTGLILPADLETIPQLWFERHYGGFGGPRGFAALTYCGAGPGGPVQERARVTAVDWDGREVRRFAVYGAGICGAGANMAFRKTAFSRLGGFDLSLGPGTPARGGEDLVLFMRLLWEGGRIGFEPRAMISHSHRADYAGLRKQLHDYGLGYTALMTALVWQDPRHLGGILSQLPAFLRQLVTRRPTEEAPTRPDEAPLPGSLRLLEPSGMLRGSVAYLHSRLGERRRIASVERLRAWPGAQGPGGGSR